MFVFGSTGKRQGGREMGEKGEIKARVRGEIEGRKEAGG